MAKTHTTVQGHELHHFIASTLVLQLLPLAQACPWLCLAVAWWMSWVDADSAGLEIFPDIFLHIWLGPNSTPIIIGRLERSRPIVCEDCPCRGAGADWLRPKHAKNMIHHITHLPLAGSWPSLSFPPQMGAHQKNCRASAWPL